MLDLTLPDGTMAPIDDGNVGRSAYFGALPSWLPTAAGVLLALAHDAPAVRDGRQRRPRARLDRRLRRYGRTGRTGLVADPVLRRGRQRHPPVGLGCRRDGRGRAR